MLRVGDGEGQGIIERSEQRNGYCERRAGGEDTVCVQKVFHSFNIFERGFGVLNLIFILFKTYVFI